MQGIQRNKAWFWKRYKLAHLTEYETGSKQWGVKNPLSISLKSVELQVGK